MVAEPVSMVPWVQKRKVSPCRCTGAWLPSSLRLLPAGAFRMNSGDRSVTEPRFRIPPLIVGKTTSM